MSFESFFKLIILFWSSLYSFNTSKFFPLRRYFLQSMFLMLIGLFVQVFIQGVCPSSHINLSSGIKFDDIFKIFQSIYLPLSSSMHFWQEYRFSSSGMLLWWIQNKKTSKIGLRTGSWKTSQDQASLATSSTNKHEIPLIFSVLDVLKNFTFEIPVILQTLNVNM